MRTSTRSISGTSSTSCPPASSQTISVLPSGDKAANSGCRIEYRFLLVMQMVIGRSELAPSSCFNSLAFTTFVWHGALVLASPRYAPHPASGRVCSSSTSTDPEAAGTTRLARRRGGAEGDGAKVDITENPARLTSPTTGASLRCGRKSGGLKEPGLERHQAARLRSLRVDFSKTRNRIEARDGKARTRILPGRSASLGGRGGGKTPVCQDNAADVPGAAGLSNLDPA